MTQVQELLDKNGVRYSHSGKDFLTKCFNPEHEDSNPSFRIDKVSGVGHCFSCNFKFNLFKFYGILTNPNNAKVQKLKQKLQELSQLNVSIPLPDGHTPFVQPYRNISPSTYRYFEAFTTDRVEKLVDRVCFPITDINGRTLVFLGRHTLTSSHKDRYYIFPTGVTLPVFPSKLDEPTNYVVLVEGLFDMLNLYDKGIKNAVCCFGTNSLQHNIKQKLLPFKTQGVTKVYFMFDADDAGRKAVQELTPMVIEEGFEVDSIDLEDNTDPGDLSRDEVKQIKGILDAQNSNYRQSTEQD